MSNLLITSLVVAITYTGIAAGQWPKIRSNRTTIALMGAGLLILLGQIKFNQIGQFLDLDTLILLFSMMIINANLRLSGFFRFAGAGVLRITRQPRMFLLIEILLVAVLSAFFLNDTICLMFTPFLLDLLVSMDRKPVPYLIALATAANIGSTATITGNPQNMIIGIASGISYSRFALALAPIALLSLGIIWLVVVMLYPAEFKHGEAFTFAPLQKPKIYKPLLIKCLVIMVGLLIALLIGAPVAMSAFIAACVLLFTRRLQPEKIFAEIDWDILVFFSALFIVTGSLEVNGISQKILAGLDLTRNLNLLKLSSISVVLSNLVSNVPAVLLLKPLVSALPNPEPGWLTLAATSTLAGNLTLLGSVANLIVAESARRRGVVITFWEYTRAGLIITFGSLLVAIGWLSLFIWK